MTHDYTLILHKPDGQLTCRSCVMESWSGQFDLSTCLSKDQVIKTAIKYLRPVKDNKGRIEPGHESNRWTVILITSVDGKTVTWSDLLRYGNGGYQTMLEVPLEDNHFDLIVEVGEIEAAILEGVK